MKDILLMVHCSVLLHNFLIEEGDDGADFDEEYENYNAALRAKKTKRRMRNREGTNDDGNVSDSAVIPVPPSIPLMKCWMKTCLERLEGYSSCIICWSTEVLLTKYKLVKVIFFANLPFTSSLFTIALFILHLFHADHLFKFRIQDKDCLIGISKRFQLIEVTYHLHKIPLLESLLFLFCKYSLLISLYLTITLPIMQE
jgi:hypothetical protein